ncbi:hypothetical protein BRN52_04835 [Xanthomonas oryzae pv. oryzae]|nr:hypothetical protein BRN52_04835 [Xanthomonas oryzae pv. oryzae]
MRASHCARFNVRFEARIVHAVRWRWPFPTAQYVAHHGVSLRTRSQSYSNHANSTNAREELSK